MVGVVDRRDGERGAVERVSPAHRHDRYERHQMLGDAHVGQAVAGPPQGGRPHAVGRGLGLIAREQFEGDGEVGVFRQFGALAMPRLVEEPRRELSRSCPRLLAASCTEPGMRSSTSGGPCPG